MKNVWKGMVLGALTGAATGAALDMGKRGAEGVTALSGAVVEHVPEVAGRVRQAVSHVATNSPDSSDMSELANQAKAMSSEGKEKLAVTLSDGVHRAGKIVNEGKGRLAESIALAREGAV